MEKAGRDNSGQSEIRTSGDAFASPRIVTAERVQNESRGLEREPVADCIDEARAGLICPNCGAPLEGRKCKLFCLRPGCGYLVTCSEW